MYTRLFWRGDYKWCDINIEYSFLGWRYYDVIKNRIPYLEPVKLYFILLWSPFRLTGILRNSGQSLTLDKRL